MTEQEEKEQQQDGQPQPGAADGDTAKIKLPFDVWGVKPEKPTDPDEVERSLAPPPGICPNCGTKTVAGICMPCAQNNRSGMA